jgi:hypothetical protein
MANCSAAMGVSPEQWDRVRALYERHRIAILRDERERGSTYAGLDSALQKLVGKSFKINKSVQASFWHQLRVEDAVGANRELSDVLDNG